MGSWGDYDVDNIACKLLELVEVIKDMVKIEVTYKDGEDDGEDDDDDNNDNNDEDDKDNVDNDDDKNDEERW